MELEKSLESALKQSVTGIEAPPLSTAKLEAIGRRRSHRRAAAWGIVAFLVLTSPISIQAAAKWSPVISAKEAIQARILGEDYQQMPKQEHGHAPNPRVVDLASLGDRSVSFGYLPTGFAEVIAVEDDHSVAISSTGPDDAFLSLRSSDASVPSTAIVDSEWRRSLKHQGREAIMYKDTRLPNQIRVKWSTRVGTQWRNFELAARGVSVEEVQLVFERLQFAQAR